jgi:dsDNA-binding SOS-regulon protein
MSDKYASNRPDDDDEDDFGLSPEDRVVLSSDLVDPYEGLEDEPTDETVGSAPPTAKKPSPKYDDASDLHDEDATDARASAESGDDELVKESGLDLGAATNKPSLKKMFSKKDAPAPDPVSALKAEYGGSDRASENPAPSAGFQREGIDGPIKEPKQQNAGGGAGSKALNAMTMGSMILMLVLLVFFGFTSFQLTGRVNQMDATLLAVGKRMVELNNSLDQLETLNKALSGTVSQGQLSNITGNESAGSGTTMSADLAAQLQEQSLQLRDILDALAQMPTQRAGLDPTTEQEIKLLTRDLSALLELEKANYLEALRAQAKTTQQEVQEEEFVAYPPPQ